MWCARKCMRRVPQELTCDAEHSALLQRTPDARAVFHDPVLHVDLPFLVSGESSDNCQVGDLFPFCFKEVVTVLATTTKEQNELLRCVRAGLDQRAEWSAPCTGTYLKDWCSVEADTSDVIT